MLNFGPDTLKQLVRDDTIERLCVEELVALFVETKQRMEELNDALRQGKAK